VTQRELEAWLAEYLAKLVRARGSAIDVDMPFSHFGLDSAAAVGLSADLSDLLGLDLADDLAYRFQTIRSLAEHLVGEVAAKSAD
jgi:acyl carrier protein